MLRDVWQGLGVIGVTTGLVARGCLLFGEGGGWAQPSSEGPKQESDRDVLQALQGGQ